MGESPEAGECGPARVAFRFEVVAHNTGRLDWLPPTGTWPQLRLSHHLLTASGLLLRRDGERTLMPRVVAPGESVRLLSRLRAPDEPGSYLVEWDLVSEGECWFVECGGRTARVPLHVEGAAT